MQRNFLQPFHFVKDLSQVKVMYLTINFTRCNLHNNSYYISQKSTQPL